jgi:hypothetical protein
LAGVGGSRWRRRFRHRKYCVVGEKKHTVEWEYVVYPLIKKII